MLCSQISLSLLLLLLVPVLCAVVSKALEQLDAASSEVAASKQQRNQLEQQLATAEAMNKQAEASIEK
jgi:hypothetical protein